jgi:hypothetical protein
MPVKVDGGLIHVGQDAPNSWQIVHICRFAWIWRDLSGLCQVVLCNVVCLTFMISKKLSSYDCWTSKIQNACHSAGQKVLLLRPVCREPGRIVTFGKRLWWSVLLFMDCSQFSAIVKLVW